MKDALKVTGSVRVTLYDKDFNVKQTHEKHNLVVTVGKTALATWLTGATQAAPFMSYVGLGTGVTAPASGDTTLQTELLGGGYSRVQGTLTSSSNVLTNTTTFPPGNGTGAVTEAGLFSASTVGTLFARNTFAAYNKAAVDTMVITWSVTFS